MKEIPADRLRIIDANSNRLGEGLRVLEEFARMTLNDAALTQKLKAIRHKTAVTDKVLRKKLLQAREAAGDVGSTLEAAGKGKTRDAADVIAANARRSQESLRVLEEMAKGPGINLDARIFSQARFELYTLEKELTGRVLRRDKIEKLHGLYAVIDTEWLKGRQPADIAGGMIKGGAQIIQLRCKERGTGEFLAIARELKEICAGKGVLFIVNDSLEVAIAVKADGLHVGQEDMPVTEARKLIPIDMILGCSVNTVKEAIKAQKDGADYLGVGAIYTTPTKVSARAIGLARLKQIRKANDLPLVAIGGINRNNIGAVIKAGANAAAVISAIMDAADVEKATAALVNIIRGTLK